jgi:hypothetical protein
MTDVPGASQRDRVRPEAAGRTGDTEVTGWVGWLAFAGVMALMVGSFQVIQGLVALFDDGFYAVTPDGLIVNVNYNAWGWAHLIIGALLILTGIGLMTGNMAARILGVTLAGLSALVNVAFLAAYPVWSVIIVTLDVIVIYAIIVHGGETKRA